ncbi:MAG: cytochrome c [Zoogloeaceae bacterium]|nr:cytochrome c [Zoogloeaceae bacterium]
MRPPARILVYKRGATAKLPPPQWKPVHLPPPPPITLEADKMPMARALYNGYCANCHGLNAVSGGVVPDLRYLTPETRVRFPSIVFGARAERGMPSFLGAMTVDQMWMIHQYLVKRAHDLKGELETAEKVRL